MCNKEQKFFNLFRFYCVLFIFDTMNTKPTNIEAYIASLPLATQKILQSVRATIQAAAPQATECISYAMPTFKMDKHAIIHFAGYAGHIGLYPAPIGVEAFKQELSGYKSGKGSVQFPLDQPMPLKLIAKIVKFRLEEYKQQQSLPKPKSLKK